MRYMVITRVPKSFPKRYAGSWHRTLAKAHKFGKSLGVKYIVTTKPKRHYNF